MCNTVAIKEYIVEKNKKKKKKNYIIILYTYVSNWFCMQYEEDMYEKFVGIILHTPYDACLFFFFY